MSAYLEIAQHQVTKPIAAQNRAALVTKNADGSRCVEQRSGNAFTISADDELLQTFAVYSMLEGL